MEDSETPTDQVQSALEPVPTTHPGGRILARGIMWVGAFRWSAQVISWGCTLVVLHILTPSDYGIVGMTTYFIGLAGVFSEFGIGSAIIASRSLSRDASRQMNTVAVALGATGSLLALGFAPLLSRYFREPLLIQVLPVLGLGFVIDSMRTVPIALLMKNLEYRRAATVDFLRAGSGAIAVLLLAVSGAGYWALVGGGLVGSTVATGWVLRSSILGWAMPKVAELREPLRYAWQLVGERLAWQGYQNADFLVAGRMFGAVILGGYNVAWTIASLPGDKFTSVINASMGPFFASFREQPGPLRHYFLRGTMLLSIVIVPVLIGLFLVADLAIPVVLGARWTPAVGPARALIMYALLNSFLALIITLLHSVGRTDVSLKNGLLSLLVLPISFVLGGRLGGITGIALAWTAAYPLLMAMPLRTTMRILDIRLRDYLAAFVPVLGPAIVMSLIVVGFRWMVQARLAPGLSLAGAILLGGAGFAGVLYASQREQLRGLVALLRPAPRDP